MRDDLQHVFWLGGGSGGGKTTLAERLAERFGLRVFSTDDAMLDHAQRLAGVDAPLLTAFAGMSMDERWVERSPDTMLETFHWFAGEGFGLIVEDLAADAARRPVVVEGFRLLPRLVAPLLADPRRAVWLLPTPEFRAAAFDRRRGTAWDIPGRTSDPERARENLLTRDRMFTERAAADVEELGLQGITMDASMTVDDATTRVAQALGLTSGEG